MTHSTHKIYYSGQKSFHFSIFSCLHKIWSDVTLICINTIYVCASLFDSSRIAIRAVLVWSKHITKQQNIFSKNHFVSDTHFIHSRQNTSCLISSVLLIPLLGRHATQDTIMEVATPPQPCLFFND